MSLDISPLFFQRVSKLVQVLDLTYDEIFQALAAADVLLPKPFQDLDFDGVVSSKSPASEMFFSVCQTRECPRPANSIDIVKAEVQKWLREKDVFYSQNLENFTVHYEKCLNGCGEYVEK
jgi:hypothetical protein